MKETGKRAGEGTNRFGDMVEHMVLPNLAAKFEELDFTFTITKPEGKYPPMSGKARRYCLHELLPCPGGAWRPGVPAKVF